MDFSRETVERLLATGEFFWPDLYRPEATLTFVTGFFGQNFGWLTSHVRPL